jgi:3-oxoacyl-[acyl-carrier protein] reductase
MTDKLAREILCSPDLGGAVALVTGSGRGLGRIIAELLLQRGADVALHDIDEQAPAQYGESPSLSALAASLSGIGPRTLAVTGDITRESAVAGLVRKVESDLGPISILVNCAGGDIGAAGTKPNPNGALDISIADAMAVLQRNFIGTMLMCRSVVPGMAARTSGAVVNIASLNAHQAVSSEVVYGCSKAAIVHYTRCLALEMRPHGVRVNAVSPGPTKTARFLATRETDPAMIQDGFSLERYATPAEIARAVAFLASGQSDFISGQVLRVDGGSSLDAA